MRVAYLAAAAYAAVYLALDLNKLYALRYGADLGTYLQTLVNLQHGSSWNFGEWKPHFQVHDSFALVLLVPLLALVPRAETLIAVQVIAIAAAAIPLALLARNIGLGARASNFLAIAYLLSPATQGLTYDNFSENVFVPVLCFSGALFARKRLLWPTLVVGALLVTLKEDQVLFVLWFAAACTLWWDRRIGLGLGAIAAIAGAAFALVERLAATHPNVPSYGLHVYDPAGKIGMALLLLAPFAFAPLWIGRWLLLGVPLLAEIVFMAPWNYEPSRVGSHYTAPLLAATAIAAAFGLRGRRALSAAMVPCALLVTLFLNDTVLRVGRWPYVVDPNAYASAAALRGSAGVALLRRRDEGVWAVAAVNPNVRLDPRPDPSFRNCPAYDRDARAFFASLRGEMPARLCGGVPVAP
ncbi:MAG TPA: DUF2079 domain-containing protein [Candidatus Cybelea sp.]|nr:DUF2079 domain-containing protein [Candidatus Cybelea sp.]